MKKQFDLAFTNLGTGRFILKTVSNLEEYWAGHKEVNPTGNNDVEVQFLDGELSGKATEHIEWVLEKLEEGNNLEDIEAVINVCCDLEEAEKNLEEPTFTLVEADNKFEAFETYMMDSGELDSVPKDMIYYLDFEMMFNDWTSGSMIVEKVKQGTYLIDYIC